MGIKLECRRDSNSSHHESEKEDTEATTVDKPKRIFSAYPFKRTFADSKNYETSPKIKKLNKLIADQV